MTDLFSRDKQRQDGKSIFIYPILPIRPVHNPEARTSLTHLITTTLSSTFRLFTYAPPLHYSSDAPHSPPSPLPSHQDQPFHLEGAHGLDKLGLVDRDAGALAELAGDFAPPHGLATGGHVVQEPEGGVLELVAAAALGGAGALGEEAHVDAAVGVGGGGLEGGADEAGGLPDVVAGDRLREAHLGVGFGEADHGFELAGGRGDAFLGGAYILAQLAHFDVAVDQFLGCVLGDGGVDGGAGVRDV